MKVCSFTGCERAAKARGWCSTHYGRWFKNGTLELKHPRPEAKRQWLVDRADYSGDDCLTWPYTRFPTGYGVFSTRVNWKRTYFTAHRAMCEIVHGPAPSLKHVAAHSCGKGHEGCVNPRHLRWATAKENSEDRVAHGTSGKGERSPMAKLTEAQAIEIRTSPLGPGELAAKFGVGRKTINEIRRGKKWKHLQMPTRYTRPFKYVMVDGVVGRVTDMAKQLGRKEITLRMQAQYGRKGVRYVDPPDDSEKAREIYGVEIDERE